MSENIDADMTEDAEVEEQLGNPAPPPDVDLEKLRGDRIGDTVFSGKWCIQTVMKLMQSNVVLNCDAKDFSDDIVDMEEDLQNEVGALWDMTSNVQVCQYLHSVGAVESICHVITNSRCPRATEMCVGMLANIIYHNELWDIMKDDTSFFSILIQLLSSTDQPVLLEVNRFFNTALCHKSSESIYSTLEQHSVLIAQEMLRILSGSTNAELLKQATELVYSLMYRDEDDSKFNARFASVEFVMAVLEASKELGCSHESPGQNTIMEVLHCFTTYQAGVIAIGQSLEDMSSVLTCYLRAVCQQGLSLTSSCPVVTSILSTLHHALQRSASVKAILLASPNFLHCVLLTLVALYRKLGLYHTISSRAAKSNNSSSNSHHHNNSKHQHHHHHHRLVASTSTWQSQEEEAERSGETIIAGKRQEARVISPASAGHSPSSDRAASTKNLQGSWSERAFASTFVGGGAGAVGGAPADNEVATFRTPDASPRLNSQKAGGNSDLLVSWSERRLASPLVALEEIEGKGSEGMAWKRPHNKRKLRRKEGEGKADGGRIMEGESEIKVKDEDQEVGRGAEASVCSKTIEEGKGMGEEEETKEKVQEDVKEGSEKSGSDKLLPAEDLVSHEKAGHKDMQDSSETLRAMKIQGPGRVDGENRGSGGFTPNPVSEAVGSAEKESEKWRTQASVSSSTKDLNNMETASLKQTVRDGDHLEFSPGDGSKQPLQESTDSFEKSESKDSDARDISPDIVGSQNVREKCETQNTIDGRCLTEDDGVDEAAAAANDDGGDSGKAKDEDAADIDGGVPMDVGFDYVDKDISTNNANDNEEHGDNEDADDSELNKSLSGGGGDRYTLLYGVIKELLVDYLQGLAQASLPHSSEGTRPSSSSKATVTYLDRQCSSTELRALIRCVEVDVQSPLESAAGDDDGSCGQRPLSLLQCLVQLCDDHRAVRLKSVLLACTANGNA